MKNSISLLLATAGFSALLLSASAQPVIGDANSPASMEADTNNVNPPEAEAMPPEAPPDQAPPDQEPPENSDASGPAANQPVTSTVILPKGSAPEHIATAFPPPSGAAGTNVNDLNLDFKNAPLDMVLSYLSDAAGFIIVQDTRVNGTITVMGQHLTQDEAVNLLNTELNQNNYAAIRNGRTLTIVDKSDAKTRNIPVMTGNDPSAIPNNDEIATWIIPIRFVDAQQLVSDLSSFVSPQATIVANQAGNSIVVTDTQANIRHLAEIIQAVDDSAQAETEIRVFRLKYANPTDVATELGSVFPNSSSGSGTQSPIRFGGGGGRGGGGRGGFFAQMMANAAGGNSSNDRVKKETQVTAVADSRIQAVIVTAPKDLMDQIADMMTSLDVPSERDQSVYVFQMKNGDPEQAAQVLQGMFQSTTSSRGNSSSSSSQTSALQQRTQNGVTTMGTTTATSGIGTSTGGAGGGGGGFGGGGR